MSQYINTVHYSKISQIQLSKAISVIINWDVGKYCHENLEFMPRGLQIKLNHFFVRFSGWNSAPYISLVEFPSVSAVGHGISVHY